MQIKIPIEEVSYMLFICFNYCNQRNNLGSICNGECQRCCISSSPLFPYHNTMETCVLLFCVLLLVFFCIFKKIMDKGECLMDKCL